MKTMVYAEEGVGRNENNGTSVIELVTELDKVFPEYADNIKVTAIPDIAQKYEIKQFRNNPNKMAEYVGTRRSSDGCDYSLVMYTDGTYVVAKSRGLIVTWAGGNTISAGGSTTVNNKNLTVFNGMASMQISPISYVLVAGSNNDHFNSPGTATLVDPSLVVVPKIISAYPYKVFEDASGPAYADFLVHFM